MAMVNPYNYVKPSKVRVSGSNSVNYNVSKKVAKPQNSAPKQDAYLVQKVMTAKPEELTLMLYEGMVKFIKLAKVNLEKGNIQEVNNNAIKAQNIVTELKSTLNMDIEISQQMDQLYDFVYDELVEANVKKDSVHFDNALEIAEELTYTWKEVMKLA